MTSPTLEVSPRLALYLECLARYQSSIIIVHCGNIQKQFKPSLGVAGVHYGEGVRLTKHEEVTKFKKTPVIFLPLCCVSTVHGSVVFGRRGREPQESPPENILTAAGMGAVGKPGHWAVQEGQSQGCQVLPNGVVTPLMCELGVHQFSIPLDQLQSQL